MKFVITLISSLIVGLSLGASGFSPLVELQRLLEGRRKIFYSIVLFATAFVLALTGFIVGAIEVALQYEAQGFLMWSALLTLAAGFLVLAVLFGLTAKAVFPDTKKPVFDFSKLDGEHPLQILTVLAKRLFTEPGAPFADVYKGFQNPPQPTAEGAGVSAGDIPFHAEEPRRATDIAH